MYDLATNTKIKCITTNIAICILLIYSSVWTELSDGDLSEP